MKPERSDNEVCLYRTADESSRRNQRYAYITTKTIKNSAITTTTKKRQRLQNERMCNIRKENVDNDRKRRKWPSRKRLWKIWMEYGYSERINKGKFGALHELNEFPALATYKHERI
jgi:hypothetical protein